MEVEVKAKVDNLDEIKEKLKTLGAYFDKVKKEEDFYYKLEGEIYNLEPGSFTLRVRDGDRGKLLTFKAFTDTYGVWDEHEVKIDDIREIKNYTGEIKIYLSLYYY